MSSSREQDLYDNADAKVRYEAYRCEFSRYEAYRWAETCPENTHLLGNPGGYFLACKACKSCVTLSTLMSVADQILWPGSRLQAAAVAHGESLPIPEIVAIGGQSDGKSSLLEAFLGFRFNIRYYPL